MHSSSFNTNSLTNHQGINLNQAKQESKAEQARNVDLSKTICAQCQKENPKSICGRCRSACYCDANCQRSHWTFHKQFCIALEKTTLQCTMSDSSDKAQKVAIQQEKDVVSFSFRYRTKNIINELKKEGYRGLQNRSADQLKDWLKEQNYVEILKCVWTEKDINFKLNWLRTYAEQGHVILMFELSRAIGELLQLSNERILEAAKWRSLGIKYAGLDAACFTAKSIEEAIPSLVLSYPTTHLIDNRYKNNQKIMEKMRKEADELHVAILKSDPKSFDVSPRWLMYHGIEGINTIAPQEEWSQLRKEKHAERLSQLPP